MSGADVSKPRYIRVNTLKLDPQSALLELRKLYEVLSTDSTYALFCFSLMAQKLDRLVSRWHYLPGLQG